MFKHVSKLVLLLIMLVLCKPALTQNKAQDDAESIALRQRIVALHKSGMQLKADGKPDDWEAFLELKDVVGDASGDDSRDLIGISLAPMNTEIRVMLRVQGTPTTDPFTYVVGLDLRGSHELDLLIEYPAVNGPLYLKYYKEDGSMTQSMKLTNSRVVIHEVIEFVIRMEDLQDVLPTRWWVEFADLNRKPWIRAWSYAWRNPTRDVNGRIVTPGRFYDYGATVASYRLTSNDYTLDPQSSRRARSFITIPMPVKGMWFCNQGPFTERTHKNSWAYDLAVMDQGLRPSVISVKGNKEKHYSWNRGIYAPVKGRVLSSAKAFQDYNIGEELSNRERGNHILLEYDKDIGIYFGHLRSYSLKVEKGDQPVQAGQLLGRVGNSGYSLGPHVHMSALRQNNQRISYPIAFTWVRVGLNPVQDDPWTRKLSQWVIHEGYFMRPMNPEEMKSAAKE